MPTQHAPNQLFTRITAPGRRFIPVVDGLRFLAIAAVVGLHLQEFTRHRLMDGATLSASERWLAQLLAHGNFGVPLFFTLSGFLLALPFARHWLGLAPKPGLRPYFLRRITRLEPPYVVALLSVFGALSLALGPSSASELIPNLLASLAYQHNLLYGQPSLVMNVAWSLEIEVQFYVLAPLLCHAFRLRPAVRRTLFLAVMTLLPALRPDALAARWNSLPFHLEFFAAGFLLVDLYLTEWNEDPPRRALWDVATLTGFPLIVVLLREQATWLLAPAVLWTYLGAFRGRFSAILENPWLTAAGGMCYSTYLLHYTVLAAVGRVLAGHLAGASFTVRLLQFSAVALPAVIFVCGGFFLLIERPCMRPDWPRRLLARYQRW